MVRHKGLLVQRQLSEDFVDLSKKKDVIWIVWRLSQ